MTSPTYDVILADPPWEYNFSRSKNREIKNHYPTMKLEAICALNVPSAENSVLYLWATAPKLREALIVMKRWGFEYKSCAVWDKEIDGMGYWFRGRHEHLLVGTKGDFSPPEPDVRFSSVIRSRRSKHSRKPVEAQEMIETAFPEKSKIEMFAREVRPGWACWGNEVPSTAEIKA